MKLLVIEDDQNIADYIVGGLDEEGHSVTYHSDGASGFLAALDGDFDVLIIDRMLPKLDGLSVIQSVRKAGCGTPILILSAMADLHHRLEGLQNGADDYLVKPFAFSELSARISVLGRRPALQKQMDTLSVGDLKIDILKQKVERAGVFIDLQPREYRLLCYLADNVGRVVTRTMLLESVWDLHFDPKTNVVETIISRLRHKVDKPFDIDLIKTVRGI